MAIGTRKVATTNGTLAIGAVRLMKALSGLRPVMKAVTGLPATGMDLAAGWNTTTVGIAIMTAISTVENYRLKAGRILGD
jgi:hypothetical protein